MNERAHHRRGLTWTIRTSMTMVLLGGSIACAAGAGKPVQGDATGNTAVATTQDGGAVENLQRLIDAHQLTEMRTTYNGSYGTSELFQPDKLTYFVTLFRGKTFWRVISTDSIKNADSIYRTFIGQTEQLAQVDLDAMRLQAGNKYAAQMIATNQQRLQSLQQDASRQRQEAEQVSAQQQQATQQATSLSTNLQSTSAQLDAVRQHIRELEAQQNNPELLLPSAPPTSAPAASSSSP